MDTNTIISVLAGGLVTAIFSWLGTKQLRREAKELKRLNTTILLILEEAGYVKLARE